MTDSLVVLVVALLGVIVAWKVLKGLVKAGAIVLLIAVAVYFLVQGGF